MILSTEEGFAALAAPTDKPEAGRRYMMIGADDIPYSIKGENVEHWQGQGAKLASAEEMTARRETFVSSVQEGEHPYLSPAVAFAAPLVEEGLPFVGGYAERGLAKALGGEEGLAFVERAKSAHPGFAFAGGLTGTVAGIAASSAGIGLAGKAATAAGRLLGVGATAAEAVEAGAAAARTAKAAEAGLASFAEHAGREALVTGVQGAGAGWNEAMAKEHPADTAQAMLSAAKSGAISAALGVTAVAGVGLGRLGLKRASQAYAKTLDTFAVMSSGEGARVPGAVGKAGLKILGAVVGKGSRGATGIVGDMLQSGEFEEVVAPSLISNADKILAAENLPTAARRISGMIGEAKSGAEGVARQLEEHGLGDIVANARDRKIFKFIGIRQHVFGQNAIDRMVEEAGSAKVARIAGRLVGDDIVKPGRDLMSSFSALEAKQAEYSKQIGRVASELDAAGVAAPDLTRLAQTIFYKVSSGLEQETQLGLRSSEAKVLEDAVTEPLMKRAAKGTANFQDFLSLRKELAERAFAVAKEGHSTIPLRRAYRVLNEEIEKAIGSAPEGERLLGEWRAGNQGYSDFAFLREHLVPPSRLGHGMSRKGFDPAPTAREMLEALPEGHAITKEYEGLSHANKAGVPAEARAEAEAAGAARPAKETAGVHADEPIAEGRRGPPPLPSQAPPVPAEFAAEAAKKLRAIDSIERIGERAEKGFFKHQAKVGLFGDGTVGRALSRVGHRAFVAAGGLGVAQLVAPESSQKLQEWARQHPEAAAGVAIAGIALATGIGSGAQARVMAKFVALGQEEAMRAMVLAKRSTERAVEGTAKAFLEEVVTAGGASKVLLHHGGAEAAKAASEDPSGLSIWRQARADAVNPESAAVAVAKQTAPIKALMPQHGAYLQAQMEADRAYLSRQVAPPPPVGYFDAPPPPSRDEQRKLEEVHEAMYDTSTALGDLARRGRMVPSHVVDAIRETRPAIYADFSRSLLEGAAKMRERGQRPDHADRLRMGEILGVPLDVTAEPGTRIAYAHFWAAQPAAPPAPPPPRGRGRGRGGRNRGTASEAAASGE